MHDERVDVSKLISAAKCGDTVALNELLHLYRPDVREWIEHECGDQAAAQVDLSAVTQDALLYLARQLQEYRGSTTQQFVAWLKSISRHKLIDEIRKQQAAKRGGGGTPLSLDAVEEGRALADTLSFEGSTPSERAIQQENLLGALQRLPEQQREVARMRYVDGRSLEEISQIRGTTPQECAMELGRALRKLRTHLKNDGA